MIGETLRRFRFAPILTATVLTILLLLLVKSVANVLVLLFLGIHLFANPPGDFHSGFERLFEFGALMGIALFGVVAIVGDALPTATGSLAHVLEAVLLLPSPL